MQAFKVIHPYQPNYPNTALTIYRVKREFQIGVVTWPVGAIRFWDSFEYDNFIKDLMRNLCGDKTEAEKYFNDHLEQIEFRYPEA